MLTFAKSAHMPNAVDEGRNNSKAFGFNAHAEGMNGAFVVITKKLFLEQKKEYIKPDKRIIQ